MMTVAMKSKPSNMKRLMIWSGYAVILIVAPMIFNRGASLSLLSQMGTLMIFGLSYNMLLGQGGMLSFGHAVYSGLGAFFAIHAMNLAAAGALPVPVTLIPLVGGIAGMFFGVLFGYVTTRKSGTTFAMITLGIGELIYSASLMFPGFFGGEGGISTNRVIGQPILGITYGPQTQVYYLIAVWLFVSTIGMYAFSHTPLGRISNAVRDNPERVEFIGYDTQWARYLTLIVSAFFAGVSGGLSAINFEIVSAENVSAVRSGSVLLFTFIGGAGIFFGPMIGAIVGVFLTVMLSDYTKAWQLYLGAVFIVIVMYAPGGIASLVAGNLRLIHYGKMRRVWPSMAAAIASAITAIAGVVWMVEMLYHVTLDSANGRVMRLAGQSVDTASWAPWLCAAALAAAGGFCLARTLPAAKNAWGHAVGEIEELIRREQA